MGIILVRLDNNFRLDNNLLSQGGTSLVRLDKCLL